MKTLLQLIFFSLLFSIESSYAQYVSQPQLDKLSLSNRYTKEQLKVLNSYSQTEYGIINHALRTKDRQRIKEARNPICTIDKLMTTTPGLKENLLVYRGHYYLQERGDKVGYEFNAETFVSTSLSKTVALKFAEVGEGTELSVLDVIEVDPAFVKYIWLAPYSSFKHEKEILLDRNIRFKVVDVKRAKHPKTKSLLFVRTLNVVDNNKNDLVEKILNCPK